MFRKITPRKEKFFILLTDLAKHIEQGTKILYDTFSHAGSLSENTSRVHLIEKECDEITHKIINELNETFVTPFDKEDIYQLTNALDDVMDSIDSIMRRMNIYKLKRGCVFGPQMSQILLSQVYLIVDVINTLHNFKEGSRKLIQIKTLETEGDSVFKEALINLFETQNDAIELIKEKEILETFEKAVDRCQRVAIVMESILIKNV